jgi:hypothetical protein
MYYTSKVLHYIEARYIKIEKVALALVSATRKLKLYFQAYQVILLTDLPLIQILHKPDLLGFLVKCGPLI